jgi:hypothetical protein
MTRRRGAVPAALTLVALVALVAVSSGCGTGRREAGSLAEAVDRYRRASMDAKGGPAEMVERVACTDAEVCAAKEACLASVRPTVRGMALKREVQTALDDLEAARITREQAQALGLSAKLDEASHAVEEGRANLAACDTQVLALRMKYGL